MTQKSLSDLDGRYAYWIKFDSEDGYIYGGCAFYGSENSLNFSGIAIEPKTGSCRDIPIPDPDSIGYIDEFGYDPVNRNLWITGTNNNNPLAALNVDSGKIVSRVYMPESLDNLEVFPDT